MDLDYRYVYHYDPRTGQGSWHLVQASPEAHSYHHAPQQPAAYGYYHQPQTVPMQAGSNDSHASQANPYHYGSDYASQQTYVYPSTHHYAQHTQPSPQHAAPRPHADHRPQAVYDLMRDPRWMTDRSWRTTQLANFPPRNPSTTCLLDLCRNNLLIYWLKCLKIHCDRGDHSEIDIAEVLIGLRDAIDLRKAMLSEAYCKQLPYYEHETAHGVQDHGIIYGIEEPVLTWARRLIENSLRHIDFAHAFPGQEVTWKLHIGLSACLSLHRRLVTLLAATRTKVSYNFDAAIDASGRYGSPLQIRCYGNFLRNMPPRCRSYEGYLSDVINIWFCNKPFECFDYDTMIRTIQNMNEAYQKVKTYLADERHCTGTADLRALTTALNGLPPSLVATACLLRCHVLAVDDTVDTDPSLTDTRRTRRRERIENFIKDLKMDLHSILAPSGPQ